MTHKFIWRKPQLPHSVNEHAQEIGLPVENWLPREISLTAEMPGKYCKLVAFNPEQHSTELFKAFSLDTDARNWTYLPYGPFDTETDFYNWCSKACISKDPQFYTVVSQFNERITGMASFLRIAPEVGSIEVGHIHFSPLMQGTRLATEAMFLMMRRVFDELGYRRYEWKCDALNSPSCEAAERLGFQFEGIFRQAVMYKQRNRDTAWFAIVDGDWPRLRAGFEIWLADDNFDTDGLQIRSLKECF